MNIEQTVIQALSDAGWDAYADAPNPMPASFVTVERTGGGARDMVDRPILAVQCWADGRKAAADMADAVRAALEAMEGTRGLGGVSVSSLYNWPDPHTRKARYQIVAEVAAHI